MLIFDEFASKADAEAFAETQEGAVVCETREESDKIDPFPFALTAPIVLVERPDPGEYTDAEIERVSKIEENVVQLADMFGGRFAGT